MPAALSRLLTEKQTAELLSVHPGTLSHWRNDRPNGLRYIKVGTSVRYRAVDVEKFLRENSVTPTAVAR